MNLIIIVFKKEVAPLSGVESEFLEVGVVTI